MARNYRGRNTGNGGSDSQPKGPTTGWRQWQTWRGLGPHWVPSGGPCHGGLVTAVSPAYRISEPGPFIHTRARWRMVGPLICCVGFWTKWVWILFFNIKNGTLQPTLCRENLLWGGVLGADFGHLMSILWPCFHPLQFSTASPGKTCVLLTQSSRRCSATLYLHSKEALEDIHTCCKEKPPTLLAAISTFPLKHHKKQTEVKVKSFSKHWLICLQNLANGGKLWKKS